MVPPTMVAALRLARTRLTLAGLLDPAERRQRRAATAALRSLPSAEAGSSRRVLVFSLRGGWYSHTGWEAVVGHALQIRGATVHVFNCGGVMPICEVNFRHADPKVACADCRLYPDTLVGALGLERSWLATYLTDADRAEIAAEVDRLTPAQYEGWTFDAKPVGALVRNSVLWFLRKSRPDLSTHDATVYRDFLIAGAEIARMAPRLLDAVRPDVIVELNGLFFAEQILNAYVPAGCRVATYEAGWRLNSLGFDWLSDRGFADVDDAWDRWRDRPLSSDESARLDAWIQSRRAGDMQRDFYVKFDGPGGARGPLESLGLDPARPTAVLFTNLVWDTAVLGRNLGFRSIGEWIECAVDWFATRPDLQLVIRIHPAEDLRPAQETNEKLSDFVNRLTLPANVRLVPSAAPVSSYALIEAASAVLVYTSTAGLEAALYGRPALVAARVYYASRGFTRDAANAEALGAQLDGALSSPRLSSAQVDLARRFAYLLLFRFLCDIPVVKQRPHSLPLLEPSEAPLVAPGQAAAFDRLMERLLHGGPFVDQ